MTPHKYMVLPDVAMPATIGRLTMESVDLKAVFTGVRPGGCVQPHLEGFAAELISAGYATASDPGLRAIRRTSGAVDGFAQPGDRTAW